MGPVYVYGWPMLIQVINWDARRKIRFVFDFSSLYALDLIFTTD